MIKSTVLALGAGLALAAAAGSAQAMPAAPALDGASPLVENVAMGCGPGFFRGPRGFCRPMGGYGPRAFGPRRFYGPPRAYGRRFYGGPGPRWRY